MKRRRITQSLGVAGLTFAVAAGALPPSALASPGEVDAAPVSLEVPTDDLERVRDIEGNRLHVLALEDEYQDEKTAAAVTVNDEAVLLRSLYAPEPGEPTSDAIESGLSRGIRTLHELRRI